MGGTDVTAMTACSGYTETDLDLGMKQVLPFHSVQITPELCSGWRRDKSRVSVGILVTSARCHGLKQEA